MNEIFKAISMNELYFFKVLGSRAGYNIAVVQQHQTAIQYIFWPINQKINVGYAMYRYDRYMYVVPNHQNTISL